MAWPVTMAAGCVEESLHITRNARCANNPFRCGRFSSSWTLALPKAVAFNHARMFQFSCSALVNRHSGRLHGSASLKGNFLGSSNMAGSFSNFRNTPSRRDSRKLVLVMAGKGKASVNVFERVFSAVGYFLPLFDGIQYGRYFFVQYPIAEHLLRPLFPVLQVYKSIPYSNLIVFFALYLLVVSKPSFSRYIRFNILQALLLDVLLILPMTFERTFGSGGGIVLAVCYNTVFLFLVACVVVGVLACILGKTPRLPLVAGGADSQLPW